MYCPNCASRAYNNTKFCAHCGANLATIADLLNGRIIEAPQSEDVIKLLEKCHNGYLSTIIGSVLVITALLIVIAALMFSVPMAAISGLIFLGWAIPAIAQGVNRWMSAKSELSNILGDRSSLKGEDQAQKRLASGGTMTGSGVYAGSVTEVTTASLDQRT